MPLAVTVCQCQDHPLTDPCRHILSVSPYDIFGGRSYLLHYVVSSIVPCRTQFIVFPLSVTKGTRYANTSSLYRDPHPSLYRVFGWKAVGAEQSRPAPADVWMRSDESRAAPVGIFPRDVGLLHPSKFEGRSGSSRVPSPPRFVRPRPSHRYTVGHGAASAGATHEARCRAFLGGRCQTPWPAGASSRGRHGRGDGC
jgi:hypothetical protein